MYDKTQLNAHHHGTNEDKLSIKNLKLDQTKKK